MPDRREEIRSETLRLLDEIKDPCSVAGGTPIGLTQMGLVKSVDVSEGGEVEIDLRLTSPFCHMIGFMRKTAIDKVGALDGVTSVDLRGDAGLDWSPELISVEARERLRDRREEASRRLPLAR